MRLAMGIEYDGSRYHGWQAQQAGVDSVQRRLEQALSFVADHPVAVTCAGRTDAGVHASRQVVHFDTGAVRSARGWVYGANSNLPDDIGVTWVQEVPDDFHARFSATARRYRYVILNRLVRPAQLARQVTWNYRPLDEARMQAGAMHLLGELDFTSFRAVQCQSRTPMRNVQRLDIWRRGDFVVIDIQANAFLHHMVRNIAGVLMAVGAGEREPGWVREVLAARDRRQGGVTAPPYGLYFVDVEYPARYGIPRETPGPFFLATP